MRKNMKLTVSNRSLKTKVIAGVLSSAMLFSLCPLSGSQTAYAATEHWNDASAESTSWLQWKETWKTVSNDYEQVSLTPGANETMLNFAWYSHTNETPRVRLSVHADMSDAKEFVGTQEAISLSDLSGYYSNKATVTDLKENTAYYYQVFQNGSWQEAETYTTQSFSQYSILYVGDPQIGACKNQTSSEGETMVANKGTLTEDESLNLAARNDSYNWNITLNRALEAHPEISFMISAGDQVNYGNNETEYAGYLSPEALDSLPVATTIGNHDSSSFQYSLHYNNPNSQNNESEEYTTGRTAAGTDYYYTYGSVLFIVLDTNNYNCATHKNVIEKAVNENPDAKWRVVTFHQDIYGSGYDHSDSDGMILRTQLTPIMDEYDIDVVLQGHDHTYSRTFQLTGDGADHTAYNKDNLNGYDESYQKENLCYEVTDTTVGGTVVNPEGTIYMEANSATGSKFYNLIASQQDFISERSQTWTPSYSVIDVTEDSMTISTYDVETGRMLSGSSSYTIVKKEVEKQNQKITCSSSLSKTYGDKKFSLDAKTSGNGSLTYTSSNEKVAKVNSSGKVTITGTGKTTITVKAAETAEYKAASKTITLKVVPAQQTAKVKVDKKNNVTISWKKDTNASGYQIVYSANQKFTKNVTTLTVGSYKTISRTVTGFAKGKTLYTKVRSYKIIDGKKVYGDFSKIVTVTCR
ncbi:MAG: FN3 domain-containing metallophosphoesterase family protein [Clostridiales bacterium]|nr:FN3 domain-containing metallophosphoesterase family protein [Clostridiales bacterium]